MSNQTKTKVQGSSLGSTTFYGVSGNTGVSLLASPVSSFQRCQSRHLPWGKSAGARHLRLNGGNLGLLDSGEVLNGWNAGIEGIWQEGHRADDGCSWLNLKARVLEGLEHGGRRPSAAVVVYSWLVSLYEQGFDIRYQVGELTEDNDWNNHTKKEWRGEMWGFFVVWFSCNRLHSGGVLIGWNLCSDDRKETRRDWRSSSMQENSSGWCEWIPWA